MAVGMGAGGCCGDSAIVSRAEEFVPQLSVSKEIPRTSSSLE